MIGVLLFVALSVLTGTLLLAEAYLDAKKIKSGKTINHFKSSTGFGIMVAVVTLYSLYQYGTVIAVVNFLYMLSTRFLCFDLILNHLMGWPTWYVGNTALTDKFKPTPFIKFSTFWGSILAVGGFYYDTFGSGIEYILSILILLAFVIGTLNWFKKNGY